MRKLLSILGALMITSSTTFGVVACGADPKNQFTKPTINDDIKNMIIAELKDNAANYGHLKFGDIFNNATSEANLAVQLIDQIISTHYYSTNEAIWAKFSDAAHNGTNGKIDTSKYTLNTKVFENWIQQLAIDKLYNDYLTAYNDNNYLEYQINGSTSTDHMTYFIDEQDDGWHVAGIHDMTHPIPYTDTDLSDFTTLNEKGDPVSVQTIKNTLVKHFHDYLYHKEIPDVLKNVIGQTFLNQGMFKSGRDQSGDKYHTFMDITNSAFLKNWQAWPDSSSTQMTTNVKMVWQYKVKVSNDSSQSKINEINDAITTLAFDGSNVDVNNSMGKGPTNQHNIDQLFKNDAETLKGQTNLDKSGSDPIWGIPHFQGYAAYNAAGTAIGTTPGDATYNAKIKTANTAGFILNKTTPDGKSDYAFYDANHRYAYFGFVLPIYAIDLFNNMSLNFGEDQNSLPIKDNIQLKTYYGNGVEKSIDWNAYNQGPQTEEVKFLHDYSVYHASSKEAGFGTLANDNETEIYKEDTGAINDGVDATRLSMVKWIQSIYASDDTVSKAGKTLLYSMAFNYDKDNIYSSNLYTAISSYIRDDNDDY